MTQISSPVKVIFARAGVLLQVCLYSRLFTTELDTDVCHTRSQDYLMRHRMAQQTSPFQLGRAEETTQRACWDIGRCGSAGA